MSKGIPFSPNHARLFQAINEMLKGETDEHILGILMNCSAFALMNAVAAKDGSNIDLANALEQFALGMETLMLMNAEKDPTVPSISTILKGDQTQ